MYPQDNENQIPTGDFIYRNPVFCLLACVAVRQE